MPFERSLPHRRKSRVLVALTVVAPAVFALALGFLFSACGRGGGDITALRRLAYETNTKVLLIGVDGAAFTVMEPLLAEGRLPNLSRLLRAGAHGILKSEAPMLSPAIWTTIVTGQRRERHGIQDFTRHTFGDRLGGLWGRVTGSEPDVDLVTSRDRSVSALWNWMGLFGKTVGFQGWWASWPAEPVNGWIITDRATRSRWTEWTADHAREHLTYPPELMRELAPLIVDPADPPMDEIDQLVELTPAEREEFAAAEAPIFAHGPSVFKFAYCTQRSHERFALRMLELGQPDLMGVFLIANDPICHTFWHYYEPEAFTGVDPADAARLGRLIPNFYEHNDRFIGELLARIDPNTVVMIVSDHGFQASGVMPTPVSRSEFQELKEEARASGTVAVGQSGKHHLDGIFIACGPGIAPTTVEGAGVADVAPTILAVLGLPVPEDLAGRVLEEILDPAFRSRFPLRSVASLEPYVDRKHPQTVGKTGDAELTRQLRALGYVD